MLAPQFQTSPLDRRSFIRLGFAGTAALLLPTGCAGYRDNLKPEEEQNLRFLSVKDFAILQAAADAILPNENGFPSHRELGIANKLDEELAKWEPVRSKDVPVLLRLIEHGTLFFGYSFTRFTRLSLRDRREYLVSGWGESSWNLKRAGFVAIKGLLAFYYFSDPKVWPKLGYDGPWLGRFDIPITEIDGLPV